ncbi:NlpC/P60 family protein [Nocardia sp. NPDC049707]|uniref:NlpC/P60 family protein n=1 Tax=Nocardia sp. NPDC049707 TaxID=3154735 RepID=UPI00342E4E48
MIDVSVLVQPLLDLLSSFGTGVLPTGGPADALTSTSTAIEQVHALGRNSINQVNNAWDGAAADSVTAKALRVQTSAATISDRGNDMATVVNQAAAQVESGQKELNGIVQSFVNQATSLGPALVTPEGLAVLVGSAIDHIGQGLNVVGRVRNELDTQTASMNELTPAPSTPSLSSVASTVSTATQGASQLSSTVGTVMSGAGGVLSSLMSTASKAGTTTASTASTSTPSTSTTAGQSSTSGTGVKITLPDGSVVEAPNEKAATAVKSAVGAVGTPYVWGGNTPGSGLDCSGLTKYAYGEAGVELPRLAQEQGNGHMQVSPGDLMPGDLAVWDGHVAMVIGNGQFVEAGNPVQISSIRTDNIGMNFYGFYRPTS